MPLYEYSCEKCSRKVELLIRGDEKPECPHCHSTKLTKLLKIGAGEVLTYFNLQRYMKVHFVKEVKA